MDAWEKAVRYLVELSWYNGDEFERYQKAATDLEEEGKRLKQERDALVRYCKAFNEWYESCWGEADATKLNDAFGELPEPLRKEIESDE